MKKQDFSTSISETSGNVFLSVSWLVSFGVCIYIQHFFDEIFTRVNQKKIKSSIKEYIMGTCFKFWPMKNIFRNLSANKSLIMACLQIYRELLSLATFLLVHSNSEGVPYLPWQNKYFNLKTNGHIELKFSLWTNLPKNLPLAKYIIYAAATLIKNITLIKFGRVAWNYLNNC